MPLSRFIGGPPEGVKKLNALVDAVNDLNNLRGDDTFITLRKGPSGALISLNVQEVIRRVPRPPSSSITPFEIEVADSPMVLAPGIRGALWFPSACQILACAFITDEDDTFGVSIGSYGFESLTGAGSAGVLDTTLSGWTLAIPALTWVPITITETPSAATWIVIALEVSG